MKLISYNSNRQMVLHQVRNSKSDNLGENIWKFNTIFYIQSLRTFKTESDKKIPSVEYFKFCFGIDKQSNIKCLLVYTLDNLSKGLCNKVFKNNVFVLLLTTWPMCLIIFSPNIYYDITNVQSFVFHTYYI